MVGNEKQADQKGALVVCDQPGGTAATVPHRRDNDCVNPRQPPNPSAEKLALRGEPTARMLVEALAAEVERMSGALHVAAGRIEAARVLATFNQNAASERAFEHGVVEANAAATPQTIAAARAYLSTRAQQEEALIEAALNYATAVRSGSASTAAFNTLYVRTMALALPVEGCAPDASSEKKLGKKGGG